jgi:Domain of unknown function (DUF4293)
MIQRVQSIFLVSSTLFILSCFFTAIAHLGVFSVSLYNIKDAQDNIVGMSGFFAYIPLTLIIALNVIALFGFKNRQKQLMWIRLTFIVLAVVFILNTFTVMGARELLPQEKFVPGMGFIAPFLAFILNFLALKAIKKDEALVRSVNRIR